MIFRYLVIWLNRIERYWEEERERERDLQSPLKLPPCRLGAGLKSKWWETEESSSGRWGSVKVVQSYKYSLPLRCALKKDSIGESCDRSMLLKEGDQAVMHLVQCSDYHVQRSWKYLDLNLYSPPAGGTLWKWWSSSQFLPILSN